MGWWRVTAGLAVGLCIGVTAVRAQVPGLTKDTFKCESTAGKTLAKFVGSKTKCVQTCLGTQRKSSGPFTDCFHPYGGATLSCIDDPVKGVATKAGAAIAKACGAEAKCPKCYSAPDCLTGTALNPFVVYVETNLDLLWPEVYCLESGSGGPITTPDKAQAKCEDGLTKGLTKFVGAKAKCYVTCGSNAFKGTIPQSACTPPAADKATMTCIANATSKTTASINKVCFGATPIETPACYDGSPGRPNSSTGWVGLVEETVDSTIPTVACGSPGGAFLD
jgi:hypothetical protein